MNEKTMTECDMDDTFQIVENCKNLEKQKTYKRKKIRRLVDSGDLKETKIVTGNKCKRILITAALIIFIIALLMGHYFTQNSSNTRYILKEFLKNYRNHYTEIVHGKSNYCDQKQLDTTAIFARIKQNDILHQEQAMHQIEIALRNEIDLNAIALVGPVGVGKTLFIRALQQNFPWQENVHTYVWNTYVEDEAKKIHLIRLLIDNLSECGQNLLVIENLQARDHGAVAIINQLLIEANAKVQSRVVLFYVFNLNTMLNAEEYAVQQKLLQSLPDCNVVNFKSFTHDELRDCIQRESEIENVSLTEEDYDEIVETIDPFKSGCKNVNAKVLIYGSIKTKEDNY